MPNDTITKEYLLKVTVTADRAPMEANNDGPAISTGIFRAFDQWPNHAVTVEEMTMEWIDVNERQPDLGQRVIFIISSGSFKGEVFGGAYRGNPYANGHIFSTPGHSAFGSHWMPIPNIPKPNK